MACIHLLLMLATGSGINMHGKSRRYLYIAFIYNVCYTLALFWMLLFYVGTEELLEVGVQMGILMSHRSRQHPLHC